MSALTAGRRLRLKLDIAYPALRASSERIWCSPRIEELYPVYLRTMHGIVRSAVPLLECASARARELACDDPVAAALADYYARHAEEERGHDGWLLEDLAALGADPGQPLREIPSPRVATFAGAQYYWLRHHHPVALLGHMAVVEGYPPQVGFAARLQRLTGYPADAFRAVRRHERLDIRHRRELYDLLDALALEPEHEALIGISALHTLHAAIGVLDEIHASAASARTTPAGAVGRR
ncbi:MAG: hypothetical protein QOJ35_155 [Solirubrobacteraceae bacterium]|jgi:hypothetical protein|nr:hypothetical protein [Solirubrobacteraceae bacterium]